MNHKLGADESRASPDQPPDWPPATSLSVSHFWLSFSFQEEIAACVIFMSFQWSDKVIRKSRFMCLSEATAEPYGPNAGQAGERSQRDVGR